jgi:alpha-beta hydrolase superfamily lysophospholipase
MQLEICTAEPKATRRLTPLLFVHGAWHGAWCWQEHFMPYFGSKGFRSYALSLRGHGKSENDKSLRWVSANDYVADVRQVVEFINQQAGTEPVLVGHSMGGYIVQKYLEKYTAPAAILMAALPPHGAVPSATRAFVRHPGAMLKATLQLRLLPVVGTPELTQAHFFSKDMPREKVLNYHNRMQDESFRVIFFDSSMLNLPKPKLIKGKNVPMLVLGAANDTIFRVGEIEGTARAYDAQVEIFPDMAHDMMLEAGWQKVADHMIGWLDEHKL